MPFPKKPLLLKYIRNYLKLYISSSIILANFRHSISFSRIIPLLEWWSIYSLGWSCWRDAEGTLQVNRGLHSSVPSILQGLHLLYNFMKIIDWDIFCLVKLLWEKHNNTYEVFSALWVSSSAWVNSSFWHWVLCKNFIASWDTHSAQTNLRLKSSPNTKSITYPLIFSWPVELLCSVYVIWNTREVSLRFCKLYLNENPRMNYNVAGKHSTEWPPLSLHFRPRFYSKLCLFPCLGCT